MKPKNPYVTMLWISFLWMAVSLVMATVAAGEGSDADANESSVESFVRSDERETLYSRAAHVSKVEKVVAIAVYVRRAGRAKGIDHAKKISRALFQVGIPCRIIVETHGGKGIGFSFYANGFGIYDDELGEKGVFSPRSAIRVLPKVVAQHRAKAP